MLGVVDDVQSLLERVDLRRNRKRARVTDETGQGPGSHKPSENVCSVNTSSFPSRSTAKMVLPPPFK